MDDIDRRIVSELQADGRQTIAGLAGRIGLSASATHDRVKRLERDGSIIGYGARVAPEAFGVGFQALIAAELSSHSRAHIEAFERGIIGVSGVRACYHVTGRFDYVLHVAVRDLNHLRRLIKRDIAAIPGVDKLETQLVLSEVKADVGWPAPDQD